MNCKEVEDILQLYVDGFAAEEETRLATEHLAQCPGCREQVAAWGSAAAALRSLERVTAPPGFLERVMEQVAMEPIPVAAGQFLREAERTERAIWPPRISWSWAAAAAVMVGVGLVLWLGPEGSVAANAARGLLQLMARFFGG